MGSSQNKSEKIEIKYQTETSKNFKVETKLVQITIVLKSGKVWDKTYNIEETLSKIENDFKIENDMATINKNYYIEMTYNNSIIEMNSTTLKKFMKENNIDNSSSITINQEIKPKKADKLLDSLEICDIFGKPLFNPFKILIIERKQKLSLNTKTYQENLISEVKLNKFSIESAYCNGNNHLYISGGLDPSLSPNETLDLFWDIDLQSDNLDLPIKIQPKKNHSMIYANRKVFMIGGNDEKTIVYDIGSKTISNLCDLKIKRFEPSLIRHDNYLFCFDSSKKNNDDSFSFERLDLNNLAKPSWEIIIPNISPNLGESIYSQKFFGLVEDYNQNIIFIGGIYDKSTNYDSEDNNMKIMNTRYNIAKNILEKSDIPFKEISLSEKAFLPLNDKVFFIIPNYSRKTPEIIFYNRDKNEVQISSYKSDSQNKTRKKKNINPNLLIKNTFFNINFDMPGRHKEKLLNNNISESNNELNIIEPSPNNEITMKNSNLFNIGSPIQPPNYENDPNTNINKEENYKEEHSLNKRNNNNLMDVSLDSGNKLIEDVTDKEHNIKNRKIELSENIGNDKNAVNINVYNYELTPENNLINGTNNLDKNLNIDKTKEQNRNNDINNIEDIKINIKEKQEDIIVKKHKIVYGPQISHRNYRIKFHNSVNDPCNFIGRIKFNNLISPKYISQKIIKRKANKILQSEKNEIRINNY